MKKVLFALLVAVAATACYDDSALRGDLDDLSAKTDELSNKVKALEETVATLQLDVDAMTTLANALKNGKYITSVESFTGEDGRTGYTIKFNEGDPIVVYNGIDGIDGIDGTNGTDGTDGTNGVDGVTPTVEVKDVDGVLYWFINGEKVCTVYEGTPAFSSKDGKLYVQYPGSEELVEIGELVGKSLFEDVVVTEEYVEFVLLSGDTFKVPVAAPFSLEISTTVGLKMGQTEVEIPYEVKGATETTVVDVIAYGCEAVVEAGAIKVSAITEGAQLLVFADNGDGKTSIKKIVFDAEKYSVEAVDEIVPAEGGNVTVKGVSNVAFDVVIPSEAAWLTQVETKTAFELTFAVEANTANEPREAVVSFVRKGTEEVLMTVKIAQAAASQKEFADRVAAYYSTAEGAAWCSFIPGIANRTMASDGKYVYLQSSEGTPKVYAVKIASLLAGDAVPVFKELSTANMSGGTHAVSTLRCIPNESGDPILIATNLAVDDSQNFNIYAYSNGTEADPVLFHAYRWDGVANVSDWRRYGDRISVSGTWQNGKIYAPSQSGTKVMGFGIKDGATSADLREYCWFDTFTGGLAEATMYPGTNEALLTTAASAGFWTPNTAGEVHGGGWPKWDVVSTNPELNGAFSFQFFTHNEKKYIAYVQLPDNKHCDLVVVEDLGSLAASVAGEPVFTAPLYEGEESSCTAANTYGDCAVVEVEGALHIVAMMQGGGLSIFKLN